MYCGFTITCPTDGPTAIRLTPIESCRGPRPSLVTIARDTASQTAAVLLGRIFYHADLYARLPISPNLREASDAALALAAYRHLGREGLEHIEGEFALVIWDGLEQHLWALRDPFGTWPLFWSITDTALSVGTSLDALVAERPCRSFNLDALAEYLMQPLAANELACEQTAYEGVQRIQPGTLVKIGPSGQATRHTWWDWPSRIERTEAVTLEEAGARFGSLLRQAVSERLPKEGPVAAHLSGGMDSSSLVCLARNELAARAGSLSLITLSLVYQRPSLVGERAYIDHVLRQGGPVEPHFLEADETLHFDWFREELPHHDEPCSILRTLPTLRLLTDAADRLGAVMTLTGEGADEIADYPPYHLADLVRRGRWLAALKEAGRWSRGGNRGMWSILCPYGLEPLWPVWSREGWGPWWRKGYGTWPRMGLFTIPPWVRPDFARRYQLRQRGQMQARQMFVQPAAQSWDRFMLRTTSGDWERWHLAAPRGLNLSHPFRDPRLVCFALGLPANRRGGPGTNKPVLQTAVRGLLPEEIRTRRDKRGFNEVYYLGLQRNLSHLERMVRNTALHDLGIVDPEKLIPVLHKSALGIGDVQANDHLDKTLALIAWFDQIVRRRGDPITRAIPLFQ